MSRSLHYGGLVFDTGGRVLLREPKGHFGLYVWTFPKGGPEEGETPEETAVRETQEETGLGVEVLERIPGSFSGTTSDNVYFLMRPTGQVGEPDDETATLRWATPDEARDLIRMTKTPEGVKRDLDVLEAALVLRSRS